MLKKQNSRIYIALIAQYTKKNDSKTFKKQIQKYRISPPCREIQTFFFQNISAIESTLFIGGGGGGGGGGLGGSGAAALYMNGKKTT